VSGSSSLLSGRRGHHQKDDLRALEGRLDEQRRGRGRLQRGKPEGRTRPQQQPRSRHQVQGGGHDRFQEPSWQRAVPELDDGGQPAEDMNLHHQGLRRASGAGRAGGHRGPV
jgi:hypothetical protein